MSALFDLFAAISTQPAMAAAALAHDTTNPEYRERFSAACREMGADPDFPDVTSPDEPDLPASTVASTTTPMEF